MLMTRGDLSARRGVKIKELSQGDSSNILAKVQIIPNSISYDDDDQFTNCPLDQFPPDLTLCSLLKNAEIHEVLTNFESILRKRPVQKVGMGARVRCYLLEDHGPRLVLAISTITPDQMRPNKDNHSEYIGALSDVVISKSLSDLKLVPYNKSKAFPSYLKSYVVQGVLDEAFRDADEKFANAKLGAHVTDNHIPKTFLVREITYGGIPLRHFQKLTEEQMISLFAQLCITLAVAEDAFAFEHTALNDSNLLIRRCRHSRTGYYVKGKRFKIPTFGLKICLIGVSQCRIKMHHLKYGRQVPNVNGFCWTSNREGLYSVGLELARHACCEDPSEWLSMVKTFQHLDQYYIRHLSPRIEKLLHGKNYYWQRDYYKGGSRANTLEV